MRKVINLVSTLRYCRITKVGFWHEADESRTSAGIGQADLIKAMPNGTV
jgi:hypothetical protein